jgi:hypothetical protein
MVRQVRRALRLARDLVRLVGAFGRMLAWVVLTPPDRPGVAILEGDPLARVGTPSTYRVRSCNPTERHRPVQVVVIGWLDAVLEPPDARFRVEWSETLQPGAASDRWIRTSWRGDVEVLATAPNDSSIWSAEPVIGRWHVEARASEAAGSSVLHASGTIVR